MLQTGSRDNQPRCCECYEGFCRFLLRPGAGKSVHSSAIRHSLVTRKRFHSARLRGSTLGRRSCREHPDRLACCGDAQWRPASLSVTGSANCQRGRILLAAAKCASCCYLLGVSRVISAQLNRDAGPNVAFRNLLRAPPMVVNDLPNLLRARDAEFRGTRAISTGPTSSAGAGGARRSVDCARQHLVFLFAGSTFAPYMGRFLNGFSP